MKQLKNMLMLILCCLLVACGVNEEQTLPVYRSLDDLSGKKVGALTGCFQEAIIERDYPEVEVLRIDNPADVVQALATKRCEAVVLDDYIFLYHSQNVKGLKALDKPLVVAEMGFCFGKGKNTELREAFNEFLKKIKADGTYDEIYNKWLYHANDAEMPDITLDENAEPIRIATASVSPPLDFIKDGKLVGFDIELATRFAASIGRRIIWSDMNFAAVIPALVSGTQDMIVAAVNITPQRAESIDFSDPYFVCGSTVGIRAENSAGYVAPENESGEGFMESVKNGFYRNVIEEDRYLMIWDGLKLTALISLFASLFGTLLGGLVCWMRMCRWAVLRQLAGIYVSLMRGTPVLEIGRAHV